VLHLRYSVPNLDSMKEDEVLKQLVERIAQKLVELRKKKGYSSYESFAFDHDIPRMQYWRIEKGKTNITLKSLVKILAIHKLTVEEFFGDLQKEKKILTKKIISKNTNS
jgi:transcriptional regulator with XRE-family HTH domain